MLYYYIKREGPNVSGLTYKSRAKWKMLRGIYLYSAIYGEVNVSVSVCVEIKGDYIEKYRRNGSRYYNPHTEGPGSIQHTKQNLAFDGIFNANQTSYL